MNYCEGHYTGSLARWLASHKWWYVISRATSLTVTSLVTIGYSLWYSGLSTLHWCLDSSERYGWHIEHELSCLSCLATLLEMESSPAAPGEAKGRPQYPCVCSAMGSEQDGFNCEQALCHWILVLWLCHHSGCLKYKLLRAKSRFDFTISTISHNAGAKLFVSRLATCILAYINPLWRLIQDVDKVMKKAKN